MQSKRGKAAEGKDDYLSTHAQSISNALLCGGSGDVSGRAGGNSGCDRAHTVCKDPGAAIQTDLQMRFQPTFPG